jgi:hypothetical protein
MASTPPFVRRPRDKGADSICTKCFHNIAAYKTDEELAAAEREHVCNGPDAGPVIVRVNPKRDRSSRI